MRTGAPVTFGPIAIPRRRQVAQNLFRIFSVKAGMRVVTCESALEADAIYAAEGDPDIAWLCEQPLRIDQPIGKRPQYTLDLATRNQTGEVCYFEIKPTDRLVEANDGQMKPACWDQLEPICEDLGYPIGFITELDLEPKQTLIANWRVLLPFACLAYRDPDASLDSHILNLAGGGRGISCRDVCLAETTRDDQIVIAHIAKLLHEGRLTAPIIDERFVANTILKGVVDESA
jgi:hypothetical protein